MRMTWGVGPLRRARSRSTASGVYRRPKHGHDPRNENAKSETHDGQGSLGRPDGRSRPWGFRDGWRTCCDLGGCGIDGDGFAGGHDDGRGVFEERGLLGRAMLSRVWYGWVGMGARDGGHHGMAMGGQDTWRAARGREGRAGEGGQHGRCWSTWATVGRRHFHMMTNHVDISTVYNWPTLSLVQTKAKVNIVLHNAYLSG